MIDRIFHSVLFLLLPPLLFGIINKTKAVCAGRTGAPIMQPYFDLIRLFRKGFVISSTTTWIFFAGPIVTCVAVLLAGLFIPMGRSSAMISFSGDFILFAYLFGLARFFTTTAALDTGSPFEGMGASREVTFAVLTEPALFFAFLVFIKITGSLTLDQMVHISTNIHLTQVNVAPLIMVVIGLVFIVLAENCRIPVDDPTTHLELTMIHEVMILDHSGPLLGLIEYASAVKFLIFISLLISVATPFAAPSFWTGWALYLGELFLFSVFVGIAESFMARLRMSRVPLFLIAAILLCGSALVLFMR